MPVQLNDIEVAALLQVMGVLPINAFDTATKRSLLTKLVDNEAVIDTSRCIGGGDGAVFVLENVAAGEVILSIKVLRAATGWGLKEAKDAYDAADPTKKGGTLGPFRSSVPTFEKLVSNYNYYQSQYPFITNIRFAAV